ncbi:hypothetical protein Tco_0553357 [Tanacetum coccineum]
MLVDLINQRKRYFATKKAAEKRNKPMTQAQQRTYMCNCIKNMESHTLQQMKKLSFDEIKELFETTMKRVKDFVPIESHTGMEEVYVEALQVKYPIIDWEVYSEDTRNSTEPTDDKEKALWVKLKRLFEPDNNDTLWKLQRYMHDPLTWRLYDISGVHHVSSVRGHDIFMLVEKDYPLSKGVLMLMLVNKLLVEQPSEMANELLRKIFIKAERPRQSVKKGSTNPKIRGSIWQELIREFSSLKAKGIDCVSYIKRKLGNGENTLLWEDIWLGDSALKSTYPRLFALKTRKDITVAEKMGLASLDFSFRRIRRGGVEDEQFKNLIMHKIYHWLDLDTSSFTSYCDWLSNVCLAKDKKGILEGSTIESEFVALAAAGKEAEWLKNLLLEIPLWVKPMAPISIRCDIATTLAKAYSQMYNGKSRHLDHLAKGLARDLVIKSVEGMRLKFN